MMKKILFFTAFFTMISFFASAQSIIITEIYYNAPNSGTDSLEYVEIYNKSAAPINLKGFTFRSAFNDTLPNVELGAGAYFVVTFDSTFFKKATKTSAHQWKNGSLSNTGETIQLWNSSNEFMDSVRYRSQNPWPATANGNGPGMELCDLNSNNDNAASWSASTTPIGYALNNQAGQSVQLLGTPGKANKCSGGGGGTFVARNINSRTAKNTAVNINISQPNMVQPNAITASAVVTQPINGTAAKGGGGGGGGVNNALFVYTPKNGFIGTDKFEYSMCTANGCDTATINITVFEAIYNKSTIGKITAQTGAVGTAPDSLNRYVIIEGIVHSPNYGGNILQFALVDQKYKSDGIEVARATTVGGYVVKEGDKLVVKGRVGQNVGINRLVADTLWVLQSGVTLHQPLLVSALDESTEAALVALEGVSVLDTSQWNNTLQGNFFGVDVSPDNGATKYQLRIDKDLADLAGWKAPKGKFDVYGIGYSVTTQGGGGGGGGGVVTTTYQLMPRYIPDFKLTTSVVDPQLENSLKIYPSPFQDNLFIVLKEQFENIKVKDILGRTIVSINQPGDYQILETQTWKSGVYVITVIKEGRQFTSKVIKQ
ncbi:MAG: lamin tail domain-containing protein [Saprospiraceae bacterium]